MVRWSPLLAVLVAVAVQAQSSQDPAPGKTPSSSAQPPPASSLRVAPGLRLRTLDDNKITTYLQADHMQGDPDTDVILTGTAEVRRVDTILKGDEINYRKETGQLRSVGNARLLRDGTLVTGSTLRYNVDDETGDVDDSNFWMGATGGFAKAERADLFSSTRMRLHNVTYSGCPCENPSWYIKSEQVDLDFDENEGVARNGVLYFKNVPILASPYLTFPVKKERKSGFLIPTYGTSSKGGMELTTPYYLNLAPNYDMTLSPRVLAKRGVQLGAEFRYLQPSYAGTMFGTYLPNDRITGENRYYYSSQHFQSLGGGFYGAWDLQGTSDDDYFRDFSSIGLNEASKVYLPRSGQVGWAHKYFQASAQVLRYQTLQDPAAPILPQYNKLPSLTLNAQRYNWNNFDFEFTSNATRFERPLFQGSHYGQDGDRLQAYPVVSYPIVRPGWFVIPKAGMNFTKYQSTDWYGQNPNLLPDISAYRDSASRVLPIMSLDAGLKFDRDTTLFGKDSIQTLEPRLYYLRVPYRNQSALPVYDTSLADFSFSQAFQENIYSGGWDRIADANQLTVGLTTRWLATETGFERLQLSAAQRLYFEGQRVTLPGEIPRENVRSDYLVSASAALTDTLSTEVAAQYDPYNSRVARALASTRWSPQRLTSVSLSYRYQRQPLTTYAYMPGGQNQVSLAFQWPFTQRWYGVARVDYTLGSNSFDTTVVDSSGSTQAVSNSRVTQAIAGVEYKGDCCWTGRVVFQRYNVSSISTNTAIFFQLELTGLGSLGTDPLSLLSRSIPGYQNINPPTEPGTKFERYE